MADYSRQADNEYDILTCPVEIKTFSELGRVEVVSIAKRPVTKGSNR